MSSKINVYEIISGHFKTFKWSIFQNRFFYFFLFPFIACAIAFFYSINLNKNLSSLLVNFGSIFIALLVSILVLVHDQESKLEDKKKDGLYSDKKELLRQLYYNINFSILCSIVLVLACYIHSFIFKKSFDFEIENTIFKLSFDVYLITPLVVFLTANLFLNILIILKRMHALLISQ